MQYLACNYRIEDPMGDRRSPLQFLCFVLLFGFGFGSNKLPQLGSGLGKAICDFRRGVADVDETADVESRKDEAKLSSPVRAKVD